MQLDGEERSVGGVDDFVEMVVEEEGGGLVVFGSHFEDFEEVAIHGFDVVVIAVEDLEFDPAYGWGYFSRTVFRFLPL